MTKFVAHCVATLRFCFVWLSEHPRRLSHRVRRGRNRLLLRARSRPALNN